MNPGDQIDITLDRMSYGVAAVGRIQTTQDERPLVVFVPGGAPGDHVQVRLEKFKKSYWEATLIKVLTPGPGRVTPPCPYIDDCGGCQWQHLSYSEQLESKKQVLLHQLSRTTRLSAEDLLAITKVYGAETKLHYRARVQAHGNGKGLGFLKTGSKNLTLVDECMTMRPEIQVAWTKFARERPLGALSKKGMFKVEWTLTERGQILEAINKEHAAFGFTQVNPEQNKVLQKVVADAALKSADKELLIDLYAGNGNLSSALESNFAAQIRVEFGERAPEAANPTTPHVFVRHQKVSDFIKSEVFKNAKTSVVIADPPRSGLEKNVPEALAQCGAERIVLVSCDPSTLARDLPALLGDYTIDQVHLIDMFPQTYHIESVIELKRKP